MVISETDTFRQRQAAEGPEGWGRSCVCESSHGTSLCMEKLSDQLTCICEMPPPHHFVKYSVG